MVCYLQTCSSAVTIRAVRPVLPATVARLSRGRLRNLRAVGALRKRDFT